MAGGRKIRISWDRGEVTADLRDTPTVNQLFAALPCEARASIWGDEVYFELPVKARLESDARQVVEPGTVCFWVEGSALALPFGPTPASRGDECRLVTPCNVLGRIAGEPRQLKSVKQGAAIRLERVEK
jgi:uncharacterized protein